MRDLGASAADLIAEVLGGEPAWLVGGAVRDRLLGRATDDLDIALAGDPATAARAIRGRVGGAAFPLSDAFGGWRVVAPGHAWHVDLLPLTGGTLETDLAARDFTINAMAEPVGGGDVVDPHGGQADLAALRLRMVGPGAFAADPLRVLRAVRLGAELGLEIEPATRAAAAEAAPGLAQVAAERTFAELKRIVGAADPVAAVRTTGAVGALAVVLPEAGALDVLAEVAEPDALGADATLAEPLAEGLDRRGAMRWAALLADADDPRAVLRRLRASERLADYVVRLQRDHQRLGVLVEGQPLEPRSVFRYLRRTAPYTVDVTVFACAVRRATADRHADAADAAQLALARTLVEQTLPAEPLVRGDELASALGRPPGPWLKTALEQLEEDRFAGEIATREQAVERARSRL